MPTSQAKYILCKSLVSDSLLRKDFFPWTVLRKSTTKILLPHKTCGFIHLFEVALCRYSLTARSPLMQPLPERLRKPEFLFLSTSPRTSLLWLRGKSLWQHHNQRKYFAASSLGSRGWIGWKNHVTCYSIASQLMKKFNSSSPRHYWKFSTKKYPFCGWRQQQTWSRD